MSSDISILKKIQKKNAVIGVIGLGYVGLPLATAFAKSDFKTIGFEIDRLKIKSLKSGRSHSPDVPSNTIKTLLQQKKLVVTEDFSRLNSTDVIIICVPTPLRKTKRPDLGYILSAVKEIKKYIKKKQLIILESTTYPGTTRDLVLPQLESNTCRVGDDYFLAFSPERIDPGNPRYNLWNTPKVVGGITPSCLKLAATLYRTIIKKVIPVSNTECAEMVKLLENTFRAVNIGLVNEVALMCERLKLNVWEVVQAAASKPFGFMPFYPGPGIGGHCIPLDPQYLFWKLKSLNFKSRFIELATDINAKMPDYVVKQISRLLKTKQQPSKIFRVLLVGVSYKKDVSDTRESPALDVMTILLKEGFQINYSDPYVPFLKLEGRRFKSVSITKNELRKYDCAVILTDHSSLNVGFLVRHSNMVFDTRNATKIISGKNVFRL